MFQRCAGEYFEGHVVWQTTQALKRDITIECKQESPHLIKIGPNCRKKNKTTTTTTKPPKQTHRPCFFRGCSQSLKDLSKLVEIRVSSKERNLQQTGVQRDISMNMKIAASPETAQGTQPAHIFEVRFIYPKQQLCQNASHCPHVNTHTVHPGTKQELR